MADERNRDEISTRHFARNLRHVAGSSLGATKVEQERAGRESETIRLIGADAPLAVVTGASGAIGRRLVAKLSTSGHHVLAIGRDMTRLRIAVEHETSTVTCLVADITSESDRATIASTVADYGRLDVLVFGAGIYERSDDPNVLQQQFDANVHGPYALLQALKSTLTQSLGQVVFLNSSQGLAASRGLAQFAATQHAMRAIADSFRDEVNEDGVRVSSIFLGRTATERQARIFQLEGRAYTPEFLIQPEDVAQVVDSLLKLPRTAEVTNISLRPMRKLV